MIELLSAAADRRPDQVAVSSPYGTITYGELLADAERAGAEIRARGIDRFGVVTPDPAVVIALHAGAAIAGAEACVYSTTAGDDDIARMAGQLGHDLIVTDRTLDTGNREIGTIAPVDLLTSSSPPVDHVSGPRPLMVMTTGTSGAPRGVRHEWDRILRVTRRIQPAPDQRWMLAYGMNQFGGLQILIHVMASNATLVAAESFQPRDALAAMRAHDVTHASGTPTFWRFLLSEVRSDGQPAPSLQQVTLGGEAVPGALLDQIRETFPQAKVSQVYGATEFGQNVTVRDGRPGLPIEFLEGDGDVVFKVVDGELHVRSEAAMLGYHDGDPVTAGQWRATGDLVEIVGDRVEFRGRKNDVINVGGVKVHPLPVEDCVSRVPGVALVRAFARKSALTGSIVAIEVVLEAGHEAEDVERAIKQACAALPAEARPRSRRFVDTLGTTGNKLNRGAAR